MLSNHYGCSASLMLERSSCLCVYHYKWEVSISNSGCDYAPIKILYEFFNSGQNFKYIIASVSGPPETDLLCCLFYVNVISNGGVVLLYEV